jgi:hypothetical protein
VLDANQSIKDYWIKVRGEGVCFEKKVHQRAILKYDRVNNNQEITTMSALSTTNDFTYEASRRAGLVSTHAIFFREQLSFFKSVLVALKKYFSFEFQAIKRSAE